MSSWRLAWRNLLRNPSRTWISAVALASSTALLIVWHGLMIGFDGLLTHAAINLGVGEVQVFSTAYSGDESIYETLATAHDVMAAAKSGAIAYAPRMFGSGLLSIGGRSAGARIWGVDPASERSVGDLPNHLRAGAFLQEGNQHSAVLGVDLARTLAAKVGDAIAFIVQATDGSTSTELMTVRGIFQPIGEVDASLVVVDQRDFDDLFGMNGKVHAVVLSSHFRLTPEQVSASVAKAAGAGAEVRTWRKVVPSVAETADLTRKLANVISVLCLITAGLGLFNTMLMAATERVREFGILKALGTGPGRIVADVTREAIALGAISASAGGAIGVVCAWLLHHHGINLAAMGELDVGGVGLGGVWQAQPTVEGFCIPVLGMLFVTVLAALYPALMVARLAPVKAMASV